jgi:hypothetical protein
MIYFICPLYLQKDCHEIATTKDTEEKQRFYPRMHANEHELKQKTGSSPAKCGVNSTAKNAKKKQINPYGWNLLQIIY